VRYYNPADDAPAFIENYVGSHPPTRRRRRNCPPSARSCATSRAPIWPAGNGRRSIT
jgi:hypothetical protein